MKEEHVNETKEEINSIKRQIFGGCIRGVCGYGVEGAGAAIHEQPPLPQKPPVGLFHRRRPQGCQPARSTSTPSAAHRTAGGAGRFTQVLCVPVKIINEAPLSVREGCGYTRGVNSGNTRPRTW